MIMKEIPKVRYAVIGGSGTWAGEYPENTGIEGIRILQRDMEFETPLAPLCPLSCLSWMAPSPLMVSPVRC